MSRLFTFGCSFTHWSWPTWADILGREFEQYENWGQRGGGNVFIFHSLIECYKKNKLNKNDTVVVMWSSYFRKDQYRDGSWYTIGEDGLPKDVDFRGKYFETLSLISAARNLLDHWGVDYTFTSMVPLNSGMDIEETYDEFADINHMFNSDLQIVNPSMLETVFNGNWGSRRMPNKKTIKDTYNALMGPDWPSVNEFLKHKLEDVDQKILEEILNNDTLCAYARPELVKHIVDFDNFHPTPDEHLEFIEKVLTKFNISNKTKVWVKEMSDLLLEQGYDNIFSYDFTQPCYNGIWSCATNRPERI